MLFLVVNVDIFSVGHSFFYFNFLPKPQKAKREDIMSNQTGAALRPPQTPQETRITVGRGRSQSHSSRGDGFVTTTLSGSFFNWISVY